MLDRAHQVSERSAWCRNCPITTTARNRSSVNLDLRQRRHRVERLPSPAPWATQHPTNPTPPSRETQAAFILMKIGPFNWVNNNRVNLIWSGRRDSNPRPSPWQGGGFRPFRSGRAVYCGATPTAWPGQIRLTPGGDGRGFNPAVALAAGGAKLHAAMMSCLPLPRRCIRPRARPERPGSHHLLSRPSPCLCPVGVLGGRVVQ